MLTKLSRRLPRLLIGALLLALVGCGAATSEGGPHSPGAPETLAGAPDGGCGETTPAGGATAITHANGSTEVPEDPQRIVVLDSDKLDTLCALGLQDRIVGTIQLDSGPPAYLGPEIAETPTVGTISEPNVEKIASLAPDLILGSAFRTPELYEPLSQVAPTVFTENVGATWKENFLLDGQAVRRGERAGTLLADYTSAAAELGPRVDGDQADASIVRFMQGTVRLYGPTSFSGQVLADAGIARTEFQELTDAEDRRFTEVSMEELNLADGGVIYVAAYGPESEAQREEVLAGSLWQSLSAVEADRVHIVADETWMTGIGLVAADHILADLEASLP